MDRRDLENLLDRHFSDSLKPEDDEKLETARLAHPDFQREVEVYEEIDEMLQGLERHPAPSSLRHRVMASVRAEASVAVRRRVRSFPELIRAFFASWQFQSLATVCFLGGAVYLVLPSLNFGEKEPAFVRNTEPSTTPIQPVATPFFKPTPSLIATASPTPLAFAMTAKPTSDYGAVDGLGLGDDDAEAALDAVAGTDMDAPLFVADVDDGEAFSSKKDEVADGLVVENISLPVVKKRESLALVVGDDIAAGRLDPKGAESQKHYAAVVVPLEVNEDSGSGGSFNGAVEANGSESGADLAFMLNPKEKTASEEKKIGEFAYKDVVDEGTLPKVVQGKENIHYEGAVSESPALSAEAEGVKTQVALSPPVLKKKSFGVQKSFPGEAKAKASTSYGENIENKLISTPMLLADTSVEAKEAESLSGPPSPMFMYLDEILLAGEEGEDEGLGRKDSNREPLAEIASAVDNRRELADIKRGIVERPQGGAFMEKPRMELPEIPSMEVRKPPVDVALYRDTKAKNSYDYYRNGDLVGPPQPDQWGRGDLSDSSGEVASVRQKRADGVDLGTLTKGFFDGIKSASSRSLESELSPLRTTESRTTQPGIPRNSAVGERLGSGSGLRLPPARVSPTPQRSVGKGTEIASRLTREPKAARGMSGAVVPASFSAAVALSVDVYLTKASSSQPQITGGRTSRNTSKSPSPSRARLASTMSASQLESLFRNAGATVKRTGNTLVCSKQGGSKTWVLGILASRNIRSSNASGSAGFYSVRGNSASSSGSKSNFKFEIRVK